MTVPFLCAGALAGMQPEAHAGFLGRTDMREIKTEEIINAVRDMCIEANYGLSADMRAALDKAAEEDSSELGSSI